MNRHISLALLLASFFAAYSSAQTTPDEAVLAPIHALFNGMSHRDAAAIQATALPNTAMVLMRDGKPTQMTIESFAAHIATPSADRIEERIHDPLIHIDHDLAVVWAPFDLLINGKVTHCGTDLINLVQTQGKWRIAGIADTSTSHCPR